MSNRLPTRTRSHYPVLTFTVVTLAVFGLVKVILHPYLQPEAINGLSGQSDLFLQQGATEPIDWKLMSKDALATAKRQDKLILLYFGVTWSTSAKRIDKEIFHDNSVAKYLTRNFVCIRADLDDHPNLFSLYLPVSRASQSINPICQLYILSPNGKLLAPVEKNSAWSMGDYSHFLSELIQEEHQYQKDEVAEFAGRIVETTPGLDQEVDFNSLVNPNLPPVSNHHLLDLASQSVRAVQTAPQTNIRYEYIAPEAWQFTCLAAGSIQAQNLINSLLTSPTVDWIDGGFFYGSSGDRWATPVYDEPAASNAEMALLLAELSVLNHSSIDRYLAMATIHVLLKQFPGQDGLLRSARIAQPSFRTFRSKRYSMTPELLRQVFPNLQDRQWVWNNLGLRVETNPDMIPEVTNLSLIDTDLPQLQKSLSKMQSQASPSKFDDLETSGLNGICIESLIKATQILNDQRDNLVATDLFQRLLGLRTHNLILHREGDAQASPYLVDYLGFSAAALADFETTGSVSALVEGAKVLHYAMATFPKNTLSGLPAPAMAPLDYGLVDGNCPQLSDDSSESDSALVIRLCHEYGIALSQSQPTQLQEWARNWRTLSINLSNQVTPIASKLGIQGGGVFLAQALTQDGRFAVAVGQNPANQADLLMEKAPQFPVFPAIGPVWPSMQGKKLGYYVWRNGQFTGPLTLSQAAVILNEPFNLP